MNKTKSLLIAVVLLCSNLSFAAPQLISPKITDQKEINRQNSLKLFMNKIEGMNDEELNIKDRSLREGASVDIVAFFPGQPSFIDLGLDQNKLAKDINSYHKDVAKFFKKNPSDKGAFVSLITFYPGYGKPYQHSLVNKTKEAQEFLKRENDVINKNSSCNKEKFCGLLMVNTYKFISFDKKSNYSEEAFKKYMSKNGKDIEEHYPTKKDNLKPISFMTIMGTNGFKVKNKDVHSIIETAKI